MQKGQPDVIVVVGLEGVECGLGQALDVRRVFAHGRAGVRCKALEKDIPRFAVRKIADDVAVCVERNAEDGRFGVERDAPFGERRLVEEDETDREFAGISDEAIAQGALFQNPVKLRVFDGDEKRGILVRLRQHFFGVGHFVADVAVGMAFVGVHQEAKLLDRGNRFLLSLFEQVEVFSVQ